MPLASHNPRLDGDGIVLYSREAEKLYRLNSTGAYIWSLIETQPGALTVSQLHAELSLEANRLNLEGSQSLSLTETNNLIRRLVRLGLLASNKDPYGESRYTTLAVKPKELPAGTASTNGVSRQDMLDRRVALRTKVRILTVAKICLLYAAIDLYLKFAGFNALLSRVQSYPTKSRCFRLDIVSHIAALDHAQVYYPKKQMCLERSTALTLLLRQQGHHAQMVVGTQTYPPKAHAWVEVDDQVIGDSPKLKSLYQELLRV